MVSAAFVSGFMWTLGPWMHQLSDHILRPLSSWSSEIYYKLNGPYRSACLSGLDSLTYQRFDYWSKFLDFCVNTWKERIKPAVTHRSWLTQCHLYAPPQTWKLQYKEQELQSVSAHLKSCRMRILDLHYHLLIRDLPGASKNKQCLKQIVSHGFYYLLTRGCDGSDCTICFLWFVWTVVAADPVRDIGVQDS